MVICALREYNKADHYPRFGLGRTFRTVNYTYYMLVMMTANIFKISELTRNYHLKSIPSPLTVKVIPLMCNLFEKLEF